MKAQLPLVMGFVIAPLCGWAFLWGWPLMLFICPQAVLVMLVRQAQHGYDSLGGADYPDIAVAILYYPIIGWILQRAIKRGTLPRVRVLIILAHIVAIALALGGAAVRNRPWRSGLDAGANKLTVLDAAIPRTFHLVNLWRGASEWQRWII